MVPRAAVALCLLAVAFWAGAAAAPAASDAAASAAPGAAAAAAAIKAVNLKVIISPTPDNRTGTIKKDALFQPAALATLVVLGSDKAATPQYTVAVPLARLLRAVNIRDVKAQVAGFPAGGNQTRYFVTIKRAAAATGGAQFTLAPGGFEEVGWPRKKLPGSAVLLQDSTMDFALKKVSCKTLKSTGVDVCKQPYTWPKVNGSDTFVTASLGQFTLGDLASGSLELSAGPNFAIQHTSGNRVALLSKDQAALRMRSWMANTRPRVAFSGMTQDGRAVTALIRLTAMTVTPKGFAIKFETNSSIIKPDPKASIAAGGRRLAQSSTVVTVATLTSYCSGCVQLPSVGTGYNANTGYGGYAIGTGTDPGLTNNFVYDQSAVIAGSSGATMSSCNGDYQSNQYGSTSDLVAGVTAGGGISATAEGTTFAANANYQQTWNYMTNTAYTAWSELTTCVVMQAQLNYGVCEYPFSTQFVTQMTNLVQLMNTATASNSYSAWNNFYTAVSVSLLPTWGDYVIKSAQFGGAVQVVYQGTSSSMSSAESQGFSFSASASSLALSASAGVTYNQTATNTLTANDISTLYTVTPGVVTVPYSSSSGTINTTGWAQNLDNTNIMNLVPVVSTIYTNITDILSICTSSTAAGASLASAGITASQQAQLETLLTNFINNCGNTTYGVTLPCTTISSYCSPGYYPTCLDPTTCVSPQCQPCVGNNMCNPSSTAYCSSPTQCFCNCGFSGSQCNTLCWWGTCTTSYNLGQVSPSLQHSTVNFYQNCENNGQYQGGVTSQGVGAYNSYTPYLPCNDCLSAMTIPPGMAVLLFENTGFGGSSMCFTPANTDLTCMNDQSQFGDTASSMYVYGSNSSCSPVAPNVVPSCGNCICSTSTSGGQTGVGNNCPTLSTPSQLPQGPYLSQGCQASSCQVTNSWVLTCTNCGSGTPSGGLSLNLCGNSGGCAAYNNINLCGSNGVLSLKCGLC